jgi:hypothetical protein
VNGRDIVRLGFSLKSSADFPIEVTLTKIETSIASRIRSIPIVLPRQLVMGATGDCWFTDTGIYIDGVTDETMEGSVECEVEYGRPGGRKYTLSVSQAVLIPLDPTKPFSASAKLRQNVLQAGSG